MVINQSKSVFPLLQLAIFILIICCLLVPSPIFAQEELEADFSKCSSGEYTDLLGLGEVNALVLQCHFATDKDQITIFPKGRGLSSAMPWQENIDDQNAIWLFDVGANDEVNLIIDFKKNKNGTLSAELFDDQDQDGMVSYKVEAGQIIVTENQFPTVRVLSQATEWSKNGQLHYDLDIEVDGAVFTMASYGRFLEHLSTDGEIDFRISVRDTDQDGFPNYDFRHETSPVFPKHWGLHRVHLMVNEGGLSQTIQDSILWPLLGTAYGEPRLTTARNLWLVPYKDALSRRYGLVQDYSFLAPPIQVRWEESKILFLAEIVPSRATDEGWFVYSLTSFDSSENYMADFENPFMFYDLANNQDGVPELLIRAESYHANDPHFYKGLISDPNTMIRYSWKQQLLDQLGEEQNKKWDYSINLLGRYATAEKPIAVDEQLTIMSVPYDEYPFWVTEKEWDVATFVQAIDGFDGIEGIYSWSAFRKIRDGYLIGKSDQPPEIFSAIEAGFRGEYAIKPNLKPLLYFSPVDRQLHLLEAEAGVWNLDNRQQIRYRNLGEKYINQWELVEGEKVKQSLYFVSDYLIYSEQDTVQLLRTDVSPEVFTTYPPRDHEEWLTLGQQLDIYQHNLEPTDFQAMLTQFEGEISTIEGVTLSDLRLLDDGFRFQLDVQPDFRLTGVDSLDLNALDRISNDDNLSYLVSYNNYSFNIQEITPPKLSLSIDLLNKERISIGVEREQRILVSATNDSLQDATNLNLVVEGHHNGNVVEIAQQELKVLSKETTEISFDWLPAISGQWGLSVRLQAQDKTILAETEDTISVQQTDDNQLLVSMLWHKWPPTIFVLLVIPLLAAFIFSKAIGSSEPQEKVA